MFAFTCLAMSVIWIFVCRAAYRNGVNDGFGYSVEPWNPGYKKAGDILKKYGYHRWGHLLGAKIEEGKKK